LDLKDTPLINWWVGFSSISAFCITTAYEGFAKS